jgi:hypothetical protein
LQGRDAPKALKSNNSLFVRAQQAMMLRHLIILVLAGGVFIHALADAPTTINSSGSNPKPAASLEGYALLYSYSNAVLAAVGAMCALVLVAIVAAMVNADALVQHMLNELFGYLLLSYSKRTRFAAKRRATTAILERNTCNSSYCSVAYPPLFTLSLFEIVDVIKALCLLTSNILTIGVCRHLCCRYGGLYAACFKAPVATAVLMLTLAVLANTMVSSCQHAKQQARVTAAVCIILYTPPFRWGMSLLDATQALPLACSLICISMVS